MYIALYASFVKSNASGTYTYIFCYRSLFAFGFTIHTRISQNTFLLYKLGHALLWLIFIQLD